MYVPAPQEAVDKKTAARSLSVILAGRGMSGYGGRRRMRRVRRGMGDYYEVDDGLGFAPLAIAAGAKAAGIHISLKGSSAPASDRATDDAAARARAGDPSGLAFVVKQGGFTSNGGWRGAVGKGADYYARDVLNSLIDDGTAIGPRVSHDSWTRLPDGSRANIPTLWRLASQLKAPAVSSPGMAPPTGSGPAVAPPAPSQPVGIMAPGGGVPSVPGSPGMAPPTGTVNFPVYIPSPSGATGDESGAPPAATPPAPQRQEAGLFGGGGDNKTLLVLTAVGLGAVVLSNITKR